jgi:peptidoglycan/xylan/chitin deacetylase (PgdA/CDA1 family)
MDVIFKGPSERPKLALTIDDFPGSGVDQSGFGAMALLDLLRELAIPTTFFAIGERVRDHPDTATRAAAAGHEMASYMLGEHWSFLLGR